MKKIIVLLALLCAVSANAQQLIGGLTPTSIKSILTLSNVENTALSTWTGSANITTVGTLTALTVGSSTGLVTWSSGALTNNTLAANSLLFASSTSAVTGNSANLTYSATTGVLDRISDAGTNTVVDLLTVTHNSSGSIVAAFGSGILFNGQSSTTADRNLGEINAQWTTATDATRVAKMVFQLANNVALTTAGTLLSTGIFDLPIGLRINGAASSGKILIGDGTNFVASTPTYPNTSATSGKIMVSDGTNFVASTPTFPNASATTRKIIVSDGTNWVASTETHAVPGTAGNILTSDGTNWTSAAPSAGLTYTAITADQIAAVGNAYINNKSGSILAITLPVTASVGQQIAVFGGTNTASFKFVYTTSQKIHSAATTTTVTTGNLTAAEQWAVVLLTCVVTNNEWSVTYYNGSITAN